MRDEVSRILESWQNDDARGLHARLTALAPLVPFSRDEAKQIDLVWLTWLFRHSTQTQIDYSAAVRRPERRDT